MLFVVYATQHLAPHTEAVTAKTKTHDTMPIDQQRALIPEDSIVHDNCETFEQISSLLDDLSCIPFEQYKTHIIGRLLEPHAGFTPSDEITNVTIDILILYRALKLNQHATNHTFTCF
jgi:hypothetical protein